MDSYLPCGAMALTCKFSKELIKGSGVDLERDGASGIKVDKYMRVKTGKDTKNVFAIGAFTCLNDILGFYQWIPGDIAIYPHHGDEVRIEHWNVRNFVLE